MTTPVVIRFPEDVEPYRDQLRAYAARHLLEPYLACRNINYELHLQNAAELLGITYTGRGYVYAYKVVARYLEANDTYVPRPVFGFAR